MNINTKSSYGAVILLRLLLDLWRSGSKVVVEVKLYGKNTEYRQRGEVIFTSNSCRDWWLRVKRHSRQQTQLKTHSPGPEFYWIHRDVLPVLLRGDRPEAGHPGV